MSSVKLYWWSPRRDIRSCYSEIRSNNYAWVQNARFRGRILSNFGDELAPVLVEAATGRRVKWTPMPDAEACVIGSILDPFMRVNTHGLVAGAGFREFQAFPVADPTRILGVRGSTSAEMLGISHATLGDPGIVAPEVYGIKPRRSLKPVIIPHYRSFACKQTRQWIATLSKYNAKVVSPSLRPRAVMEAISTASIVFTSSLHGLIIADSLGIPAVLTNFDSSDPEPSTKYKDYLSVFHTKPEWITMNRAVQIAKENCIPDEVENSTYSRMLKCRELAPMIWQNLHSLG